MDNQNVIVYSEDLDVLGSIGAINYIENTVTIVDGEQQLHVVQLDSVLVLDKVGELNGDNIFNLDIIGSLDEDLIWLVELKEDGEHLQLHLLNNKLERVESGEVFTKEQLSLLEGKAILIGSIFEIEPEETVDFNVKIVKENDATGIVYFYACNNKQEEQVDLIKVLYMGHQLLEEEEYERRTLSYEVYLDLVEAGTLKEVSPSELYNFVTGSLYGKKTVTFGTESNGVAVIPVEDEPIEEEEDCDEPWDKKYI